MVKKIKVLFLDGKVKETQAVALDHHLIYEIRGIIYVRNSDGETWRAVKTNSVGILWGETTYLILSVKRGDEITYEIVPFTNVMVPYKRKKRGK